MRTVRFIAFGVLMLVGMSLVAWIWRGHAGVGWAAGLFVPVWLVCALGNLWVGVWRAGYPLGKEILIMLLIFAVPALMAGAIWRMVSMGVL